MLINFIPMNIISPLEAILFVASQPLSTKKLMKTFDCDEGTLIEALEQLSQKYTGAAGIHLVQQEDAVQFVTNPSYANYVDTFVKSDAWGELTKAQLETLTVIAYRGPITRPELEEIRGVNCAIILRNLMMRGLVEEVEDKKSILSSYHISIKALQELGISSVEELPDFKKLSAHPHFDGEAEA